MTEPTPQFLASVDRLSKIVNAQIGRVESDPTVIVPTLMRLLCVTVVSETMHLPLHEVITNMQTSIKLGIKDARDKLETVLSAENRANDEQTQLVIGAAQEGQPRDSGGPGPGLRIVSDSTDNHSQPSGSDRGEPRDGRENREEQE